MSRIGRMPIPVPDQVQVSLSGRHIHVKGPKGTLEWDAPETITVALQEKEVLVSRHDDQRTNRALHGLTRALIANMIHGVSTGFSRILEMQGTGYRASAQGNTLQVEAGFSHPVRMEMPQGISVTVDRNVLITVSGIDKELVGRTAEKIRKIRPPEPYKGKGIRYQNEYVRRKVGKKNV